MQHSGFQMANTELSVGARVVHLGLAVFGIAAYATSGLTEDYSKLQHSGFTLHKWIGAVMVLWVIARLVNGVVGPPHMRFVNWVPLMGERLRLVKADITGLMRMRLPDRPLHQGLAGAVHAFGLLVFTAQAITGSLIFFFLEPGHKATGWIHDVMDIHEIGNILIPIFLAMHVGATLVHAISGHDLWRPMVFLKRRSLRRD